MPLKFHPKGIGSLYEGQKPKITWAIKARAYGFSSGSEQCDLCLVEKLTILMAKPESTLNKQDEILEKCKHKQQYTLRALKPPKTDQEPPEPN